MWAQTVFKSQPNQYKELEFSFHLQRCHFILYSNWECSEDIGLYFSVELDDDDDENLIKSLRFLRPSLSSFFLASFIVLLLNYRRNPKIILWLKKILQINLAGFGVEPLGGPEGKLSFLKQLFRRKQESKSSLCISKHTMTELKKLSQYSVQYFA